MSAIRGLEPVDASLIRVYMAACVTDWSALPSFAEQVYAAGGTVEQLRGCLRHLVVLAGYGPCLAATLALQKAKLLPHDTPGKVDGPRGDAFDLVYSSIAPAVREKVHSADPVLADWIQFHLYGDVYSSPGLDLRQKQLLMCARLAQANMGEQLFGHALAGLRFGNSKNQLQEALDIGFQVSHTKDEKHKKDAFRIVDLAADKFLRDYASQGLLHCPEINIPSPSSIRIPSLDQGIKNSSLKDHTARLQTVDREGKEKQDPALHALCDQKESAGDEERFVWEELDSRIDRETGEWKVQ